MKTLLFIVLAFTTSSWAQYHGDKTVLTNLASEVNREIEDFDLKTKDQVPGAPAYSGQYQLLLDNIVKRKVSFEASIKDLNEKLNKDFEIYNSLINEYEKNPTTALRNTIAIEKEKVINQLKNRKKEYNENIHSLLPTKSEVISILNYCATTLCQNQIVQDYNEYAHRVKKINQPIKLTDDFLLSEFSRLDEIISSERYYIRRAINKELVSSLSEDSKEALVVKKYGAKYVLDRGFDFVMKYESLIDKYGKAQVEVFQKNEMLAFATLGLGEKDYGGVLLPSPSKDTIVKIKFGKTCELEYDFDARTSLIFSGPNATEYRFGYSDTNEIAKTFNLSSDEKQKRFSNLAMSKVVKTVREMLLNGECDDTNTKELRRLAKIQNDLEKNLYVINSDLDPASQLRILLGVEELSQSDIARFMTKDGQINYENLGPIGTAAIQN